MAIGPDPTNPKEKRKYAPEKHCGHADPPDDWDGPTRRVDVEVVNGRLEALAEKFRRQADKCREEERYELMDCWNDAAVDVEKLMYD